MMENLNINRPKVDIGKLGEDNFFDVNISLRLFESSKPVRNKEVTITVGDEKLPGLPHPTTDDSTEWKTNNAGYLEFGFKRKEGTYRINLWIDDAEPILLTPVKLEIPKLGGFQFTEPEELKGDKGSYFVKFNCLDNKGNAAAGTIEFETQPNRRIRIDNLNDDELGEGEKFALSVPKDGISVVIGSMDSLPVILTLAEKRTFVQTMEFPKLDKPVIQKATSFTLSNLKPNPCSDGSYILKVNMENDGNPASGYLTFITEQPIEVYNHVNDKLLDKTGNAGKPPQILITALGKFVRIKPIKELTDSCKMDVHLLGTSFTKTVDLELGKKFPQAHHMNRVELEARVNDEDLWVVPIRCFTDNEQLTQGQIKVTAANKFTVYVYIDGEKPEGEHTAAHSHTLDISEEGSELIVDSEGSEIDYLILRFTILGNSKTESVDLFRVKSKHVHPHPEIKKEMENNNGQN